LPYIVRYLSAGEMETVQVEARDAAAAVASVKMNQDRSASFELLSVMPIAASVCSAESLTAP
jgi:hypothetical protein